jgi:carbon-monoxide dehydrogenase large subunit
VTCDVGGNFGSKNRPYVEYGLVLWAAQMLGRPVKYRAVRSEAFLSDSQGRDLVTSVELALRRDGRFLALRADNISNIGARCMSLSPLSKGSGLITGPYDIPLTRSFYQHDDDIALPQLRAARGDIRHGTACRTRRTGAGH